MEKICWSFSIKTTTMPDCFYFLPIFLLLFSCTDDSKRVGLSESKKITDEAPSEIRGISLPQGFTYEDEGDTAYSKWLLDLKIKKSNNVYLYNGSLKTNQHAHYAVLDIDIGKKDLIQCADAVMKLKADFLFQKKKYDLIKFVATCGDGLSFQGWLKGTRWKERGNKLIAYDINKEVTNIQKEYNAFMQFVYSYCGTYSLSKQLKAVNKTDSIQPGDVFIQGGFPGHAITVMAVAKNNVGKKIFLLSQGYMPAQDIHILKNYNDPDLSPWYDLSEINPLYTPEWQFERGSLKRW